MSDIKHLDTKNFKSFTSKGKSVIDFYADWCGPCKIMAPHFEKASQKVKDVKFAKVDIEKDYDLASEFEVMSIPTTIFFEDGEMIDRYTGAMSLAEIEKMIKDNFD